MFFRITPKRVMALAAIFAALCLLSVVFALTISVHEPLSATDLHLDPRSSGVLEDGRIAGMLRFHDPRLSESFNGVELDLRRSGNSAVSARYRWGDESSREIELRGPTLIPAPSSTGLSTAGFELTVQPLVNRTPAQVHSLRIKRSFPIAVPSLKFAALAAGALLLLVMFAALCAYEPLTHGIAVTPVVLTYFSASMVLVISPTPDWSYLMWFFVLGILLLAGYGIKHLLQIKALAPPYEPPRNERLRDRPAMLCGLLLIVTAAALLRALGITFGLPNFYVPSEAWYSSEATAMLSRRSILPASYGPSSSTLYLACLVAMVFDPIFGGVSDPVSICILTRCVVLLLGVLSVVLVFAIGRRMFGIEAGLLAAMLLAVAPLHVTCSRYLQPEVPFVFVVLLATFACLRALTDKSWQWFLLSAVCAGLALSFSWQALPLLPLVFAPPLIAFAAALPARYSRDDSNFRWYLLSWNPGEHIIPMFRRAIPGLGLLIMSALLSMPFILSDFADFSAALGAKSSAWFASLGRLWSPASDFLMYHFSTSLWDALSIPPAVLAILGCGWLMARRRLEDIALIYLVLLTYLIAEFSLPRDPIFPDEKFLVCVPFLALAFGAAGSALYRWFLSLPSKRWTIPKRLRTEVIEAVPHSWRIQSLLLIAVLTLAQAAIQNVRMGLSITDDTRAQAADWLEAKPSRHVGVVVDSKKYNPALNSGRYTVFDAQESGAQLSARGVLASNADYLLLSSLYEKYLVTFGAARARYLYQRLVDAFAPAAIFERPNYSYGYHNPRISIYDLDQIRAESQRQY